MTPRAGKLRFGIGRLDGSPGHSYWTLKVSASDQDVYIAGTQPSFVYASLHHDGNWHTKTKTPTGNTYVSYKRPDEIAPGLTRALCLHAHALWGSHGEPSSKSGVCWAIPPIEDSEMYFDVFFEAPGADLEDWPGRIGQSTELLGRRPLARGGSICVVGHALPLEMVPATTVGLGADWTAERTRELASRAKREDVRMLLHGSTNDGAIVLRHLRVTATESP